MNTQLSKELYAKAEKLMPGGVNSPVRACRNVGKTPLFIDRAIGDKIYDVDGNEYIDYVCSWGPNILGHAHPRVVDAVKKTAEKGLTFGACHEGEITLAEKIRTYFPSMEKIRLVNSGTEAVMSVVRAARGYTKRSKIIKFEGCYHGHSDGLLVKAGSGLLTNSTPNSAGVTKGCAENTLLACYNDEESVTAIFEEFGEDIAAVIVEPCAANMGVVPPKKGFLEYLRDITKKYASLLIFDEVITGFRLSVGGAQQYYGVTPDITTLGKIVGGGMPLAAYGGKHEIMECISPIGGVYQAGTLSGNPVAVSAGIETIRILEETPGIYSDLEKKSAKIESAIKKAGVNVNRVGSILTPFFTNKSVSDYKTALSSDTNRFSKYYSYMLENGIYTAPSQFEAMFVSLAHTDEDIERTCYIIEKFV
ncbi:MAG: glutamate-1-semialdehyde 2,1-aminomutase [Acutalibacteraceae bacterium]|nr:glutamate-1-semialdehyde 2,1-aminomutase [Acutalibacteraceae bacterium]